MPEPDDPIETAADDSRDLYEVATWEQRSALDGVAAGLARLVGLVVRLLVVVAALGVLLSQALIAGLALENPIVAAFTLLSVLPALALVVYVWYVDPTAGEKLGPLVATFLLAIVLASFAAVTNSLLRPLATAVPVVGFALYFYLVVAPVEEFVKWLAIRLWAYESDRFDAVIDGAVYGAIAGLGFATIENALYIGQQYLAAVEAGQGVLGRTAGTAALRTLAGPGHVVYSGIAGYYLGLAKFNRERFAPIAIKGLLLAALIHGSYNTLVTVLSSLTGFGLLEFLAFVIVFNVVFGYYLYRKLARYRAVYREISPRRGDPVRDA
jgi:RsiW-degrading membrane proteinase PrsW (M82 family)